MKSDRGVVAVEMAIVLPVFVLILIGILEFGLLLHDNLILQNASREGARFAAVGNSKAAVEQRVRDFAQQLDRGSLAVDINNAQGERGSTVVVKVSYPAPLLTHFMASFTESNTLNLQAEASMRLE